MKKRSKQLHRVCRPLFEALENRMLFAFGVVDTGTSYVVDNGANLVFSVLKGGTVSSTIHIGDLTSVKYKGTELLASYSVTSRYSHYEQGLSSTTLMSSTIDPNGQWILITADDSATAASATQYYAIRKGDDTLYMASLPTDVTQGPGEGRFITYLDRNVFTTPEAPSDNLGATVIEGGDVFGHPDGTTSSKFYNMGRRMIDNNYHGLVGTTATGSVGAYMYMGNREHSAGGPFFKDIDFQSGSAVEMYNCLFTGHTQTDTFRQGLYTYGMSFNGGATPATTLDYSWMSALNLVGWIPAAQRGTLTGTASGVPSGHQKVVALSNSTAQYWSYADANTGTYTIQGIQAGTYTETLYDNELEVGTKTVTITGGATSAANIVDTFYIPSTSVFRIGTWDGTPLGFLNTGLDPVTGLPKVEIEHPSDVRMTAWNSTPNYVVGTNTAGQWPAYQFMGVNNNQTITFNLTSAQVQSMTLRIGITWGFSGARPDILVNGGQTYQWQSGIPTASSDLNSRGITRGTWRGDNQLYTFDIPASAFRAGTNTIAVPLVSGSYTAGQTWLSPNISYDAIDLTPTTTAYAPAIASVTITPGSALAGVNGKKTFTAVAKDASGNVIATNFDWSAVRGTIDSNGNYVAPATVGTDTITATATETRTPGYNTGTKSTTAFGSLITGTGSATCTIVADEAPTIATAAAANPSPANATSATLSVLGDDNNGESKLTYTWATLGTPPATVAFSANGSNAAKTTTATFTKAGTYNFEVTVTDASGLIATSDVSLVVGFGILTDSLDMGGPATAGSTSVDTATGIYTVKGGGADFGSNSDRGRFSYATLLGNSAIVARVLSETNTNASAKAGVMIRATSANNAVSILAYVGPGGGVSMAVRSSTNGTTTFTTIGVTPGIPVWLKIIRSGTNSDKYAAYYSTTGMSWTQIGTTQTLSMGSAPLAGLAVTARNNTLGVLNTSTFDNLKFDTAPTLVSAISQKKQGSGTYNLNLSLNSSSPTIESRNGGSSTLVFNFSESIFATDGTLSANEFLITNASFASATLAGSILTLTLTGVVNAARLSVSLNGLVDSSNNAIAGTSSVVVRNLVGDVNQSGAVDTTDSDLIRKASGKALTATNYMLDLNLNGTIDAVDIALAKSRIGNTVP